MWLVDEERWRNNNSFKVGSNVQSLSVITDAIWRWKERARFEVLLRTILVHNQCWLGHYSGASAPVQYQHLFWSRDTTLRAILSGGVWHKLTERSVVHNNSTFFLNRSLIYMLIIIIISILLWTLFLSDEIGNVDGLFWKTTFWLTTRQTWMEPNHLEPLISEMQCKLGVNIKSTASFHWFSFS